MSLRSPKVMMVVLLLLSGIWIYLETTSVPPELVTPARKGGPALAPADAKIEVAAAAARFDYVYIKDLFPAQSWIPARNWGTDKTRTNRSMHPLREQRQHMQTKSEVLQIRTLRSFFLPLD